MNVETTTIEPGKLYIETIVEDDGANTRQNIVVVNDGGSVSSISLMSAPFTHERMREMLTNLEFPGI